MFSFADHVVFQAESQVRPVERSVSTQLKTAQRGPNVPRRTAHPVCAGFHHVCCEQPPDADVLGPRGESEDDLFRSRVFNPAAYTVPRVVGPRWEGTLGRLSMSGGAMHRARPHEVLQSSANLPLFAGSLGEAAMRLQLSMLSSAAAAGPTTTTTSPVSGGGICERRPML